MLNSRAFGALWRCQLAAHRARPVVRGRRHPAHPRPRPHARRRGRPRRRSPAAPGRSSAASTPGPRRATPSSCRRCCRSTGDTLAARAAAWASTGPRGRGRARGDPGRDRRALLRAVRHRARRTAARSPRASAGARPTPRRRGRRRATPTPTTRRRPRPTRPTPPPSPPSSSPGRSGSPSAASTSASPPAPASCRASPSRSTRCRSARPAMLTGADGLPLDASARRLPARASRPTAILVDDPGHPRDLTAAVRAVFETVFGAAADAVWQEAGGPPRSRRATTCATWLALGLLRAPPARATPRAAARRPSSGSSGPRRAGTASGAYAHRLTRDSLFALARDVVAPQARARGAPPDEPRPGGGPQPDRASSGPRSPPQDAVVEELRAFARRGPPGRPALEPRPRRRDRARRCAPLWRLVPHKAWQKELKSRWDDLVAGKYDWAHLAMHLWPERVVPKCATDRSLAIAHGLEDVFWVEGADGKWTKRARPTRPIEELVAERTSPAVKAALADLLAAPARRRRPGRGRGRSELMHPLHDDIARQLAEQRQGARSSWSGTTRAREFAPFVAELRGGQRRAVASPSVVLLGDATASLVRVSRAPCSSSARVIEPLREPASARARSWSTCPASSRDADRVGPDGAREGRRRTGAAAQAPRPQRAAPAVHGRRRSTSCSRRTPSPTRTSRGPPRTPTAASRPRCSRAIFHDAPGGDAHPGGVARRATSRDAEIAREGRRRRARAAGPSRGSGLDARPDATASPSCAAIDAAVRARRRVPRATSTGPPPASLDGVPAPRDQGRDRRRSASWPRGCARPIPTRTPPSPTASRPSSASRRAGIPADSARLHRHVPVRGARRPRPLSRT